EQLAFVNVPQLVVDFGRRVGMCKGGIDEPVKGERLSSISARPVCVCNLEIDEPALLGLQLFFKQFVQGGDCPVILLGGRQHLAVLQPGLEFERERRIEFSDGTECVRGFLWIARSLVGDSTKILCLPTQLIVYRCFGGKLVFCCCNIIFVPIEGDL